MTQIERRTTSTPLQYALKYASWGWPVFPCAPNSKVPPEGSAGFKDATTDAATIRRWWHAESRFNPAVAAGTHFWVLDVDPRNDGLASLEILIGKHGELPDTLAAKTPSGGFHYFFAPDPRARNTAGRLGRGLDTRGAGGYVLVEGATLMAGSYAFLDVDPMTDALPVLAPAPAWLITLAFVNAPRAAQEARGGVGEASRPIHEGGRNQALASLAGAMRRKGMGQPAIEAALIAENAARCDPPLPDEEVRRIAASVARYAPAADVAEVAGIPEPPPMELPPIEAYEASSMQAGGIVVPDAPHPAAPAVIVRPVDWASKMGMDPPPRQWLVPHWIPFAPTLISGAGGVGKSLFTQAMATGLTLARAYLGRDANTDPMRVLCWSCEDDETELWRRQAAINEYFDIGFGEIENLIMMPRLGHENTLLDTQFGRPLWTPLVEEFRQQIGDYRPRAVIVDNISHVFAANENSRHDVTKFISGLSGALVAAGHPVALILVGHTAKAIGSEFAGSSAWENACRARLFFGRNLPDEKPNDKSDEDTPEDKDLRYLARRKSNYSAHDFIKLRYQAMSVAGVFVPEDVEIMGGMVHGIMKDRARRVVLESVDALNERKLWSSHSPAARDKYLPKMILRYGMAEGVGIKDLTGAMRDLLVEGDLMAEQVVGKNNQRHDVLGLIRGRK